MTSDGDVIWGAQSDYFSLQRAVRVGIRDESGQVGRKTMTIESESAYLTIDLRENLENLVNYLTV